MIGDGNATSETIRFFVSLVNQRSRFIVTSSIMTLKCALSRLHYGLSRRHTLGRWFSLSTHRCSTAQQTPAAAASGAPQLGARRVQWTDRMEFLPDDAYDGVPMYRVLNTDGSVIKESEDPQVKDF